MSEIQQPLYYRVKKPRVGSKREAILDAALRVFCHHGYDGASVSMIAAEAGVSKGMINKYFTSKQNLFHLCLKRFASEFVGRIRTGASAESYEAHMAGMLPLFREYRDPIRLLVATMLTPSHEDVAGDILPDMAGLLGIFADDIQPDGYRALSYALYSLLLGYILGGNEANYQAAYDLVASRCLKPSENEDITIEK